MASVHLKQLKRKFQSLATHGRSHLTQRDIAKRLGVEPQTLTGWIGGRDNREIALVPDDHLETLDAILISESPHEITAGEARALWTGDLEDFNAAVVNLPRLQLDDVLRGNGQKLNVGFHPTGDGFGLDEETLELGEEPLKVADGTTFHLSARCDPRCRLVVLSNYSTGWRVLAPGKLHSGKLSGMLAMFPDSGHQPLRFRANYGVRRYVFIEHVAGLDSSLPVHVQGIDALDLEAVSRFARRLKSKDWAGKWRWGQAVLVEEKPPARRARRVAE